MERSEFFWEHLSLFSTVYEDNECLIFEGWYPCKWQGDGTKSCDKCPGKVILRLENGDTDITCGRNGPVQQNGQIHAAKRFRIFEHDDIYLHDSEFEL